MTRTHPAAQRSRFICSLAVAALIATTGCATQPQTTLQEPREPQDTQSNVAITAELASLWASPEIAEISMTDERTGPSLVAGDWLAWQCASAGGYFEMTPQTFAMMLDQD